MLLTKCILWGSIFWLPILMYHMLKNEAKPKKNLILGVTFPKEGQEDPEVKAEADSFIRCSRTICWVLVLTVIPCFLLPSSLMMTVWGIWLFIAVTVPNIPYVMSNIRLKKIKEEHGWKRKAQAPVLKPLEVPKINWISPGWFIPPVILCLIPVFFSRIYVSLNIFFAVMCLLSFVGYRYLYRDKPEMVDDDSELTTTLTRIRKGNWGLMWLSLSYFLGIICVITALLMPIHPWIGLLALILFSVLLCLYAVKLEMKTRAAQERLTGNSEGERYVDEDDYWLGGILYYNPNDKKLIVNNRIGINTTFNFARPAGKVLTIITLLVILMLPFFGVIFDSIGTQEIVFEINSQELDVRSGFSHYNIALDSVDKATLLEDVPEHLTKISGTGMETLLSGKWFANSVGGNVRLLLDPRTEAFILLETEEGNYIVSTRDTDKTVSYYKQLLDEIE